MGGAAAIFCFCNAPIRHASLDLAGQRASSRLTTPPAAVRIQRPRHAVHLPASHSLPMQHTTTTSNVAPHLLERVILEDLEAEYILSNAGSERAISG